MKIFVLAPKENWICDRFVSEWVSNHSESSTTYLQEADIVWLLADWCWNHLPIDVLKDKKVMEQYIAAATQEITIIRDTGTVTPSFVTGAVDFDGTGDYLRLAYRQAGIKKKGIRIKKIINTKH